MEGSRTVEEEEVEAGPQNPSQTAKSAREHSTLDRWKSPRWKRLLLGDRPADVVASQLAKKLNIASEALLDRLFSYLSSLPEDAPTVGGPKHTCCTGLTLPASAIGWLASQIYPQQQEDYLFHSFVSDQRTPVLTASVRDRISLLKFVLPRCKHLRITAEPWPPFRKLKQHTKSDSGRLLVESLQLDETNEFLDYFESLVNRPRVDLRLFPVCEVLLLDQVPPEWICNLSCLRSSLEVLRVERSHIFDLPRLLGQTCVASDEATSPVYQDDPLQAPTPMDDWLFPKLTHVKIIYCGLNESSGMRGAEGQPAPLARMVALKSISLAHNDLSSQRTVLSGLANKPFLSKLDLSHNQISSLRHAHYCLGNLQTLNLSHNRIRSSRGIERLMALETLWLDHNLISDVASMKGLARLPELQSLRLLGNPLAVDSPRSYRVDVLDIFREKRMSLLPERATFAQLQSILPRLDEKLASIGEMKALKARTFQPTEGRVRVNSIENGFGLVSVVVEDGSQNCDTLAPLSSVGRGSGGPRCRRRRRRVQIDDSLEDGEKHFVIETFESPADYVPALAFTVVDVLEALSDSQAMADDSGVDLSDDGRCPDEVVSDSNSRASGSDNPGSSEIAEVHPKLEYPVGDEDLVSAPNDQSQIETALDISTLSPIKHVDEQELKSSVTTTITAADSNIEEPSEPPEPPTPTMSNIKSESKIVRKPSIPESDDESPLSDVVPMMPDIPDDPGTPRSYPSPVQLNLRVVSFPGSLWQDDNNSLPSSLGCPLRDETTAQNRFALAEENSKYVGPGAYSKLLISENLDLYFRSFVFNYHTAESSQALSPVGLGIDDDDFHSLLEQYPKIQLWPLDRKIREGYEDKAHMAGVVDTRQEEFRHVWRERVVACGKPALRRLTPNRGARYGFHGELLWSAASTSHIRPETVAECREVIVCLSDACFYLILDHDAVSMRAKDQKRKFPFPIPSDAVFESAKWPHALARHPLETLRGINIGFGFQRLTLRFSNTTYPSPDDFTYIILTSNKMETVNLLKLIQGLVKSAREVAAGSAAPPTDLRIENDDRHVLDALGVAVAPDVIGAVLHFQILRQKWKHGDRGAVRRVCVLTDTKLFLLDEDYVGDGSESVEAGTRILGETIYRMVDSADLTHVDLVKAADLDPNTITISIRPGSRLQRHHNWRLICRHRLAAEQLVEDVRKAIVLAA